MRFRGWLKSVLELLDSESTPAFIRDTLEVDKDGQTVIPDAEKYLIIDLVGAVGQYAITQSASIADSVAVQVGAWAEDAASSYDLAEDAASKLEAAGWKITGTASVAERRWRGCIVTYQKLY